jgi:hypothetical protein
MFGRLGALSYVMECKANSSALRRRERGSNASTIEFGFSEAPSHSTNRGAVPSRPVVVSRDIYRRADVFRTPFIPCSRGSPIIAKCRIFQLLEFRRGQVWELFRKAQVSGEKRNAGKLLSPAG